MESRKTTSDAIPLDYSRRPRPMPLFYRRLALMLIGLVAFVLVSAIALSFFNRRPDWSPRDECRSNMKQIGLGAIMYANAHAGRFPDDLDMIFHDEDLMPSAFVCPLSGTQVPNAPTTQAAYAALKKSGSISYIYVGKGLTVDSPADAVLAYEPLKNHAGDGMNILFVDSHVEWLTAAEAQSILQQAASGVRPIKYPPTTSPAATQSSP